MKKQLRTNPVLKALAFLLAAATCAGCFWAGAITLSHLDELREIPDYYSSRMFYRELNA